MLLNGGVETLGDLVEMNAGKFGGRTALPAPLASTTRP